MQFTVAATDVQTGAAVLFDTADGHRIGSDHLLASCGFLPEFAPVAIDGRLLGDGGLAMNAPVEAVLHDEHDRSERVCVVADLLARDGAAPAGVESAFARRRDLIFGNQTWLRLKAYQRESVLRDRLADLAVRLPPARRPSAGASCARAPVRAILYLSYRAPAQEAGPEKPFDLSAQTIAERWREGALDMDEAVHALETRPHHTEGCALLAIRRAPPAG